jgi:DNA-binding GntR family transcriptional regulator
MATLKATTTDSTLRISPSSVVDIVLERLRTAVVNGAFTPGEPLQISALSEELGVSHIPVREALRLLESEGLIERHHHGRGVVVAPVTAERLRDIYRLRIAIEPDIAARSVPLMSDEDIAHVGALLDELRVTKSDETVIAAVRAAHFDFHREIVLPAASEWDLRVLSMLWQASERSISYVFQIWAVLQRNYLLAEIHQPIYDALVARDPERIRDALVTHLENGIDQLVEALETDDDA